jgi:hypothetical protein
MGTPFDSYCWLQPSRLFLRFVLNLRPIRVLRRFQATPTLAQDAVKAGAEVRLDIVLTNVSAEKIVIAEGVEPNYQIEVYDNEGKPLPKLRDCVPKQDPDHPGLDNPVPRRRYDSFGPYLSSAKSDSQTSETARSARRADGRQYAIRS